MWECFPSPRPHPLPPVWEPHVCKEKKWFVGLNGLFCILGPLGTFLVLTKIFTFWVVLWFVEAGMGDPPPLRRKIPILSRFA